MTTPDVKAAYLAGLIDGEGCFQISRIRMKNRRNTDWDWKWRYKLYLVVVMCDAPTLYAMSREFGGKVYKRGAKSMACLGSKSRQQWRWVIADAQAEACIQRVLPFLHNKFDEAIIALRFRETVAPRGHAPYYDAPERQARLAQEMKNAKRCEYTLIGDTLVSVELAQKLMQPYATSEISVELAC